MITDEKLKTIVNGVIKDNEEVIDNKDENYRDQVYTIIKKIIDLPSETITTIADLINYNPNETFVEPLTQGQIRRLVNETCKKLNIELEENRDSFSGLAYYYKFKKINNNELNNINNLDFDKMIQEADGKIAELEQEELDGKSEEEQKELKEKWEKESQEFEKIMNINTNSFVINEEKITITKKEYEILKYDQEDLLSIEKFLKPMNDFALKIFKGGVIPITNPNYYNNRISIEINNFDDYKIQIDKQNYILTKEKYETIKNLIISKLNILIDVAKKEDFNYFLNNGYEGGTSSTIVIKYNSLIIRLNGQVTGEIGDFCKTFIEKIKDIITTNAEKDRNDKILEMFKKMPDKPRTPIEEEFDKYAKLYEERFNKKAYIPEPSGTIEFAIECIKKCLDEGKDMLDDLYYPNFDKDKENGNLY